MNRTDLVTHAVSAAELPKPALDKLRAMFLAHQTNGQVYLDDPDALKAYRAYFFLQSYFKALSVLKEVPFAPRTVRDLGSAMGPAAFAAWTLWPDATIHLYDFSARALEDAARLGKQLGARVETHVHDLRRGLPPGRVDLTIAANALSELPFADRVAAAQALHPLVLIEPADREHARDLQALRDALLPRAPIAPCPHSAACPALSRERDFCHQTRPVEWPEWHRRLQEVVGLSDDRLRFSYLIYADAQPIENGVRIISNPLKDKGRLRFFGCASTGLVELIRQDKHRSEANAAFDALDRGSLISLPSPARVTKLGPEDSVQELGESMRREVTSKQ